MPALIIRLTPSCYILKESLNCCICFNYLQSHLDQLFLPKLFPLMQCKWFSFYRPLVMVPSVIPLFQEIFILWLSSCTHHKCEIRDARSHHWVKSNKIQATSICWDKMLRKKKINDLQNFCSFRKSILLFVSVNWVFRYCKFSTSCICLPKLDTNPICLDTLYIVWKVISRSY